MASPKNQFQVLKLKDKKYPPRLRQIPSPPKKLYIKGERLSLFKKPAIAVVGSRKVSNYGWKTTKRLVKSLIKRDFVIVSGMARGVDSIAHWTAIKNNAFTMAVLGSGIDVVYPPENQKLYEQIHLVISEFEPGTPPEAKNFPVRNRIVAGLADAVLVIEAAQKSGTLITARMAADQGKEVFAVTGPAENPNSEGIAWLINQGAKAVRNINDILEELK